MAGRVVLLLLSLLLLAASATKPCPCRCFPGSACWPSPQRWNAFNHTLGGKLVATVPAASVCHPNSTFLPYDADACHDLLDRWQVTDTHSETSYSPMAAWFANFSCDPHLPNTPCTIDSLVQYAVNASSAEDYLVTINFAQAHNIRLVIRNTGHDFLGRSTGAGALALWTHHLKDIEIFNYTSRSWSGPAIKVGAGVQVMEALDAAHKQGYVVVGGNCQTVGIAGGYAQGGGHGQLVSMYGLAADQVLEWEIITATGMHWTASPSDNSELHWALSGGGGGTYAAVLSMTSKLYPDFTTVSANLTFTDAGVSQDVFWEAIETYIRDMVTLTDLGGVAIWEVANGTFQVYPTTLPGGTKEQLQGLMQDTLDILNDNHMPYAYNIIQYDSFYDSFTDMSPWTTVTEYQLGGRLIPRTVVDNNLPALINALRSITGYGAIISGISLNVSRVDVPNNAVTPSWRDAQIDIVLGTAFDYYNRTHDIVNQRLMTDTLLPLLATLTPEGGAYLNEADPNQPDWQWTFYRDNYDRLNAIKNRYDPKHIFYGLKAVGSEVWEEMGDGRLCRADR
ncbi:FAD binding domain protein [Aspergillus heteromorphus CBS 117.55]|uniref:FAD binding domain protein n=1 Tax=Aspergillus heteromorphus CBS 117.55 TaxID=1448321 RepID=A0A317W9W6_9EURO|nr:FAD binding domain protein [Aspergillus heteromorphus CBS 117.55]PWY82102.1 FAD binding domain protein [Aspergillus heteromorphus CBS 117.55]